MYCHVGVTSDMFHTFRIVENLENFVFRQSLLFCWGIYSIGWENPNYSAKTKFLNYVLPRVRYTWKFSHFLKIWKSKNPVFWNSDYSLFFVRSYLCWSSPTCQRVWGEPSEHGLCCRWVSGLRTPDRRYFSGKSKVQTIDLSPHCIHSMNFTLSKSGRLWLLQRDISISDPVAALRFFPPRPCSWDHTSAWCGKYIFFSFLWFSNSRSVIPKIYPCIHPFFSKYAPVSTPSYYCTVSAV